MGRSRQTAKVSSSKASSKQVAYSVWQSSPNAASGVAPKDIKYDISYESSFFNHYFETGVENVKPFAPVYKLANTVEPYSFPQANEPTTEGQKKHWLHFYFNSKYDGKGSKVERPNLNLLIALDVSGSMGVAFAGEVGKSKIEVAQESLLTLLRQLRPDDSFGLVIFNTTATTIQPLLPWKEINQTELEKKIMTLRSGGGTDISNAVTMCSEMFTADQVEKEGFSNRIFYLTDLEVTTEDGNKFKISIRDNSKKSLWSTVVGIGLDLTQDVIKAVSKTPGCNYCNVRSNATFNQLMDQEFSAIVTPIAFNIQLSLVSQRYRFAAAYGSPEISDLKPGEIASFSTEFPSVKNDKGETRSGVILFRIEDTKEAKGKHESFTMHITWEDISGITYKEDQILSFSSLSSVSLSPLSLNTTSTTTSTSSTFSTSSTSEDVEGNKIEEKGEREGEESEYESSGVRKAILLVRYTDFFKKYLLLRGSESNATSIAQFQEMRHLYPAVVKYFQKEKDILDDVTLNEELRLLHEIAQMDDIPIDKPTNNNNDNNNNNNDSKNNNSTNINNSNSNSNTNNNNNNNSNNSNNNNNNTEVKETENVTSGTLADYGGSDKDDSNLCCVCLALPKTITLLPCNHKCLCLSCSSHSLSPSLSTCPLCRTPVESTIAD